MLILLSFLFLWCQKSYSSSKIFCQGTPFLRGRMLIACLLFSSFQLHHLCIFHSRNPRHGTVFPITVRYASFSEYQNHDHQMMTAQKDTTHPLMSFPKNFQIHNLHRYSSQVRSWSFGYLVIFTHLFSHTNSMPNFAQV